MEQDIFIQTLRDLLGPKGWVEDDDSIEPFITEWRGFWRGSCLGVARPANTAEVSEVVKLCSKAGVSISPIGGNTGIVGGGVPDGGIVLSTQRLSTIRDIDPGNLTMTVEAGCILANIQNAATDQDMMFPLSLGAEGTCQIGGNLSTNAGGVNVLRYGNARDLVLGLEVVLPSGEIWNNLKGLRKDNTGYEMKHLFMGAEGTLGIITAATLKLFPAAVSSETALIALPDIDAALNAFSALRASCYDSLSAFEIISDTAMGLVTKHISGTANLFETSHPYYALVELTSTRTNDNLRDLLEGCLGESFENNTVKDALIAENQTQANTFWRVRETIPEAQVLEGASVKHDISVPISAIPEFINKADTAVMNALPETRIVSFGHMGDGNLHYNLTKPAHMDDQAFLDLWNDMNRLVHDIVMDMNGSFSAEHGIGQLKRNELVRYASPTEINMMRNLKSALDPHNIMNPGKVIADPNIQKIMP